MFLRVVLAIALLFPSIGVASGQDKSSWFVRSAIAVPHVLPVNPFESSATDPGDPIRWVPDLTLEVGRQTDGSQDWHRLYGLPAYGVGFSVARFRNSIDHGRPFEGYVFFTWPFAHLSDRFAVTTDFGMGLSWNWSQIDDGTAASTAVLGSDLNARIDWGFYLRYRSTPRLSVYTGVDYTHRSNGGVIQPNRGINVLGPRVALQYDVAPSPARHRGLAPSVKPPFRPSWDVVVGVAGGLKNVTDDSDPTVRQEFGVFQANAALQRHFFRYGKVMGGAELRYDGSTGAVRTVASGTVTEVRADAADRWAVGTFGGYEHVIARFSVFAQLGYDLARASAGEARVPRVYQRFGWRLHLTDALSGTIAVRAVEGNHADALEIGAGYRFRVGASRRAGRPAEASRYDP